MRLASRATPAVSGERRRARSPGGSRAWRSRPAGSGGSGRCTPRSTDRRRGMPSRDWPERPRYKLGLIGRRGSRYERMLGLRQSSSSSGVERRPICTQSDNWLRMSFSLPRASSTGKHVRSRRARPEWPSPRSACRALRSARARRAGRSRGCRERSSSSHSAARPPAAPGSDQGR